MFDHLWSIVGMLALSCLKSTIWLPIFYRLFGSKIGTNVFIEDSFFRIPSMISLGDLVVIETEATLETVRVLQNGDIHLSKVSIESNVVVGANSCVGLGSKIKHSSLLKGLSQVREKTIIASYSEVTGCDIITSNIIDGSISEGNHDDLVSNSKILHILWLFIGILPSLCSILCFTGLILGLFIYFQDRPRWIYILTVYAISPVLEIFVTCFVSLCIIPFRVLFSKGSTNSCQTRLYSSSFVHKVGCSKLYHSCIASVKGSIFSQCFGILFGVKLDLYSSFLIEPTEPDLTVIGKNAFCANGVKLKNMEFFPGGRVNFGEINIGDNCMILDRTVIEPDVTLRSNTLIGSVTHIIDTNTTRGSFL